MPTVLSFAVAVAYLLVSFASISNAQPRRDVTGPNFCLKRLEVLGRDAEWQQEPAVYSVQNRGGLRVLRFYGAVGPQESSRLDQALRAAGQVDEVWMHSPGGVAIQGIAMGKVLRKHGVATRIPDGHVCFSSCAIAFAGGSIRQVDPEGCYGNHMFSAFGDPNNALAFAGDILRMVNRDRNNVEILAKRIQEKMMDMEKHHAQLSRDTVKYFQEMGISLELMMPVYNTDFRGRYFPDRIQLRRFNVENVR